MSKKDTAVSPAAPPSQPVVAIKLSDPFHVCQVCHASACMCGGTENCHGCVACWEELRAGRHTSVRML